MCHLHIQLLKTLYVALYYYVGSSDIWSIEDNTKVPSLQHFTDRLPPDPFRDHHPSKQLLIDLQNISI